MDYYDIYYAPIGLEYTGRFSYFVPGRTHRYIRTIAAASLDEVYRRMQAEQWSPNGEATPLIRATGVRHTSMSVGDVVVARKGGKAWKCASLRWDQIEMRLAPELEAQAIGLVACSKSKLDHPAPARELYQGTLFQRASAYAERVCGTWYILSAKHGLVEPDKILEPYDVHLQDLTPEDRTGWAMRSMREIALIREYAHVDPQQPAAKTLAKLYSHRWLVLAGRQYRELVVPNLPGQVLVPLGGLGIGEQIAWLSARLMELERKEE